MAIRYVDSAATGANNGTSWADAWTSIASAAGAGTAAGDEVRIDDGHSQDFGATTTLNFSGGTTANPVRLFCVDKATDALSSGAVISTTVGNLTLQGSVSTDGIELSAAGTVTLIPGATGRQLHRNTTVAPVGSLTFGNFSVVDFENCELDLSGGGSAANVISFTNSQVTGVKSVIKARSGGTTSLLSSVGGLGIFVWRAGRVDGPITNLTAGNVSALITLDTCEVPSSFNYFATLPTFAGTVVRLIACANGTLSAPLPGLSARADRFGTIQSTLSRYRTGGADDGEQANAHAWEMVSNANVGEGGAALETPPIVRWVAAGSHTVTVYVASGVTLQDDEFWAEITSPSEGGSPTAQARFQSSRLVSLGTAADLTADGASTWNGSGVGTKQKITFSISPAIAGPVTVRCYLAKASTTVYLDPLLEVA